MKNKSNDSKVSNQVEFLAIEKEHSEDDFNFPSVRNIQFYILFY